MDLGNACSWVIPISCSSSPCMHRKPFSNAHLHRTQRLTCLQVSFVTHGYAGLVQNEFSGLTLARPGMPSINGPAAIPANIANGLSYAKDLAILIGILIGARILTFCELLMIIQYNWL